MQAAFSRTRRLQQTFVSFARSDRACAEVAPASAIRRTSRPLGDDLKTIVLRSLQGLYHRLIDDLPDRLAIVRRFSFGEIDAGKWHLEFPFIPCVARQFREQMSRRLPPYQTACCRLSCVRPSYPQAFAGTSLTTI